MATTEEWLAGGGEMGRLVRSKDWSRTPLGPIDTWPQSLRTTVSLALSSNFPINIAWGPSGTQIYNDGYWPICGDKHPRSMGEDFKESWFSAWEVIGEAYQRARSGESAFLTNQRMFLDRNNYLEETFFTFSFSPIRDESGQVGGLFHPVTELTQQSLAERRLGALRQLADYTAEAKTVEEGSRLIIETLAEFDLDLPFVLLYRVSSDGSRLELTGSTGIEPGTAAAQPDLTLSDFPDRYWPMDEAVVERRHVLVTDVAERFPDLQCGPYPETPHSAYVMPCTVSGLDQPYAVLVAGVSSRRALDEPYEAFFNMLRASISNSLTNARAYEEESRRAEELARLDRAKTAFFSNVSHEFRTPLTLLLGPLEDAMAHSAEDLPKGMARELELAHRNSLRLLKLVNALLDFSRIEAGRVEASFSKTDLGKLTGDISSSFRSLLEKAGLELKVVTEELPEPVYVDHDMWEKIVLNLLSNAFKFTFEGSIEVALQDRGDHVELWVTDTGTGIPKEALPQLFDRFYRVEGASGRTYEGSGIGLALVNELVKLHGGEVAVSSEPNRGSRFCISIPYGKKHLPADRIDGKSSQQSTAIGTAAFVEEANRWLASSDGVPEPEKVADSFSDASGLGSSEAPGNASVLVVDDNADMREYVSELLREHYQVRSAKDGEEAWALLEESRPDLVLTDVMMPRVDGFELLRRIRGKDSMFSLPVILLSARAGEESRLEGLDRGADDYLVKPFSARELVARVQAHITLNQVRLDSEQRLRHTTEQLETIIEHVPVGIGISDRSMSYLRINRAALDILEFESPEELQANRGRLDEILQMKTVDGRPLPVNDSPHMRASRGETVTHFEMLVKRKSGSKFRHISASFVPLQQGDNDSLLFVLVDLTQRRESEKALRRTEENLRLLSNPVLQVGAKTLLLPLIGLIDQRRSGQIEDVVLREIRRTRARVLVIDVTGVLDMDAGATQSLVNTVRAARLLGARTILTGISSAMAERLVEVRFEMESITTTSSLQRGLEQAGELF